MSEAPDVGWHAMALTGLDLGCKLLAWHVEGLGDFLAVFLETESQVEVDQLHPDGRCLGGIFCRFCRDFDRDILHANAAVNDSLFMKFFKCLCQLA